MAKNKKSTKQRTSSSLVRIKVVGVGGAGGNIISRMSRDFVRGVDFVAINTDHQDLDACLARHKVYIGRNLTRGLGTGMNPELGRQAAEENRSEITEAVKDTDLVFVAAGLGGGTGSSVSPIVSEIAKQNGALTIAFVTKPFAFEGSQRQRIAEEWLVKLRDKVDALVVVPNDRIFSIINKDTPILKAFAAVDDVLKNALRGIVEIIATPGIINLDFADVRTIVQDAGPAIVGVGIASGQERAVSAVNLALNSPLLETSPDGAKGVLLGISGGRDMKMNEVHEAAKIIAQAVDPGARIIFGAYQDRHLRPKQIKVTLIVTGLNGGARAPSLFEGRASSARQDFFSSPKAGLSHDEHKSAQAEYRDKSQTAEAIAKHQPLPTAQATASQKEEKLKDKKSEDVWDIPTFLRRKKK